MTTVQAFYKHGDFDERECIICDRDTPAHEAAAGARVTTSCGRVFRLPVCSACAATDWAATLRARSLREPARSRGFQLQ
ncbi:MAG TPA: hypothetical protein VKG91_05120 [Roseiarcus sp.]|nr:hypothetical protein [Roseiarcus sp.]